VQKIIPIWDYPLSFGEVNPEIDGEKTRTNSPIQVGEKRDIERVQLCNIAKRFRISSVKRISPNNTEEKGEK